IMMLSNPPLLQSKLNSKFCKACSFGESVGVPDDEPPLFSPPAIAPIIPSIIMPNTTQVNFEVGFFTFAPQPGQLDACVLTCAPHSLQLIKAIFIAICYKVTQTL